MRSTLGSHADAVSIKPTLERAAFDTPVNASIVREMTAAAELLGLGKPPISNVRFWTDAAFFADAGIETVIFGPKGSGAHAPIEWVDLQSVARCASIYATMAMGAENAVVPAEFGRQSAC